MGDNEKLKNVVTNWLSIEDEIKSLKKQLKQYKEQQKKVSEDLVSIMEARDISGLNLSNNVKLIHKTQKVRSALSKKVLLMGLSDYFENEDEVKEVIGTIMSKRTEKITNKIERK